MAGGERSCRVPSLLAKPEIKCYYLNCDGVSDPESLLGEGLVAAVMMRRVLFPRQGKSHCLSIQTCYKWSLLSGMKHFTLVQIHPSTVVTVNGSHVMAFMVTICHPG